MKALRRVLVILRCAWLPDQTRRLGCASFIAVVRGASDAIADWMWSEAEAEGGNGCEAVFGTGRR